MLTKKHLPLQFIKSTLFGKIFLTCLFSIFCAVILSLTIKGLPGNPIATELNDDGWKDNGPFELSPDRGRFALTYSIVENKSFFFDTDIARFATPDLGYKNNKFVSLFAPGLSFLIIPGYLVGKIFGLSQVGAYAVISFFAVINTVLIIKISQKLGATMLISVMSSFIFLFATPAFAYAGSLYQHHVSTFLLLCCLLLYMKEKHKLLYSFFIFFLCAFSIPLDYPNAFFLFPIGLMTALRMFHFEITTKRKEKLLSFSVKPLLVLSVFGVVAPLIFFFWFNKKSYDNPLQFSGTIEAIKALDDQGLPIRHEDKIEDLGTTAPSVNQPSKKTAISFFQTRNLLNGFYTHFISRDRGILYFTPIMFLGALGIISLYKKDPSLTKIFVGTIGANVLLYSMWGDPYGGWAFGSRYLIPSYALISILFSQLMTEYKRNLIILLLTLGLSLYSLNANLIGALGSNRNPPKVEVLGLEALTGRIELYSVDRNYDFLLQNKSKSFMFQKYFSHNMLAIEYYRYLRTLLLGTFTTLLFVSIVNTFHPHLFILTMWKNKKR